MSLVREGVVVLYVCAKVLKGFMVGGVAGAEMPGAAAAGRFVGAIGGVVGVVKAEAEVVVELEVEVRRGTELWIRCRLRAARVTMELRVIAGGSGASEKEGELRGEHRGGEGHVSWIE